MSSVTFNPKNHLDSVGLFTLVVGYGFVDFLQRKSFSFEAAGVKRVVAFDNHHYWIEFTANGREHGFKIKKQMVSLPPETAEKIEALSLDFEKGGWAGLPFHKRVIPYFKRSPSNAVLLATFLFVVWSMRIYDFFKLKIAGSEFLVHDLCNVECSQKVFKIYFLLAFVFALLLLNWLIPLTMLYFLKNEKSAPVYKAAKTECFILLLTLSILSFNFAALFYGGRNKIALVHEYYKTGRKPAALVSEPRP